MSRFERIKVDPNPPNIKLTTHEHQHEHTIPVAWDYEYHENWHEQIAYKWVSILRCRCGDEIRRLV